MDGRPTHPDKDVIIVKKRTAVVTGLAAAATVAAVVGGGVAVANGGDDGPVSHQYTPAQAEQAKEAALEATGGGRVNSVESDDEDGATYEVEVTTPDGDTVDVRLDEDFAVVVIEGDSDRG